MGNAHIIPRRTPTGPMGFLNYPPEILNKIYHNILVDDRQILAFLCSPDPAFRFISLRQPAESSTPPSHNQLDWRDLYEDNPPRYYVDSRGLSAQLLRVCKKVWSEATPVLYGNLTIAIRWTPKTDPCLYHYFTKNTYWVLRWATFVYPKYDRPFFSPTSINDSDSAFGERLLHWGFTHPQKRELGIDVESVRRMQADIMRRSEGMKRRACSF